MGDDGSWDDGRCVAPLKCCRTGFNYVYKQLVLDSSFTSKFCFAEPAFHKLATYETIRNELRRTCVFRDFWRSFSPRTLKHHQNPGKISKDGMDFVTRFYWDSFLVGLRLTWMYCFKMMFGKFSIWDKFCWEAWNCSVIFLQAVRWLKGQGFFQV